MDKRKVNCLLIQHFGEEICFLYPKDRIKLQMVFSNKLQATDFIENLRAMDPIITAAKLLREGTQQYDFLLDDSFSASSDLVASHEIYQNRQAEMWKNFFDHCCLTQNIMMDYNEGLIPFIKLFTPQLQRRKRLCMYLLLKLLMKHHV